MATILLGIVLVLVAICVHELGHYEAMRRCGVRVKEVSLMGIPREFLHKSLKSLPRFSREVGETTWSIYPLPFLAGIQYYNKDVRSRSLQDQLYVSGGGPLASFVFALVLAAFMFIVPSIQVGRLTKVTVVYVSVFLGAAALVWLGRRYIALALPFLTLPILALTGYGIFSTSPVEAVAQGSGGPVTIAVQLSNMVTLQDAIFWPMLLSLGMGIMNLLPLFPFDGGNVVGTIIGKRFGEKFEGVFRRMTAPLVLVLMVYAFGLDALLVWRRF